MNDRHDDDTRWLDAQLPAQRSAEDALVRRTVAGASERARRKAPAAPTWAWMGLPLAGAFAVLLLPRTGVQVVTPPAPVAVEETDAAWSDPVVDEAEQDTGEEWTGTALAEDDVSLDDLDAEQLDGLSEELKDWQGSDP